VTAPRNFDGSHPIDGPQRASSYETSGSVHAASPGWRVWHTRRAHSCDRDRSHVCAAATELQGAADTRLQGAADTGLQGAAERASRCYRQRAKALRPRSCHAAAATSHACCAAAASISPAKQLDWKAVVMSPLAAPFWPGGTSVGTMRYEHVLR